MKKILVPIGVFLFAGLMLFNVSSSQNILDSRGSLTLQIEEKAANAILVPCLRHTLACPTNDCGEKYYCPGCYKSQMHRPWGAEQCDTDGEMFCCD